MENNEFVVIKWPDVKVLFQWSDFNKNAIQVDNIDLVLEYGNSSYLVRKTWLNEVSPDLFKKVYKNEE